MSTEGAPESTESAEQGVMAPAGVEDSRARWQGEAEFWTRRAEAAEAEVERQAETQRGLEGALASYRSDLAFQTARADDAEARVLRFGKDAADVLTQRLAEEIRANAAEAEVRRLRMKVEAAEAVRRHVARERDRLREAVSALADEWDGVADHGEDERYGRVVGKSLHMCAAELRARLNPCKECGGSGMLTTKHFDEYPAEVHVCDYCGGRGSLAQAGAADTQPHDDLSRAIRTLLPGLRGANYTERWSPASPAVQALGILCRFVGEDAPQAGDLIDPGVPTHHKRRPEGDAADTQPDPFHPPGFTPPADAAIGVDTQPEAELRRRLEVAVYGTDWAGVSAIDAITEIRRVLAQRP